MDEICSRVCHHLLHELDSSKSFAISSRYLCDSLEAWPIPKSSQGEALVIFLARIHLLTTRLDLLRSFTLERPKLHGR